VVDVICRGLAGAADVKLMGMGVERGVLGVSRVLTAFWAFRMPTKSGNT
jgi:hypothetical protein